MKEYNKPVLNIEEIKLEHVILSSGASENWTSDRVGTEPDGWFN